MKGEGFCANSILKKIFDSLFEQDIQSVTDLRVNMESKLKTEKYGILQITERNINK